MLWRNWIGCWGYMLNQNHTLNQDLQFHFNILKSTCSSLSLTQAASSCYRYANWREEFCLRFECSSKTAPLQRSLCWRGGKHVQNNDCSSKIFQDSQGWLRSVGVNSLPEQRNLEISHPSLHPTSFSTPSSLPWT